MIVDLLANRHLYQGLSPRIGQALAYLGQADLSALEVGRHEISGREVYMIVQTYTTKPAEQGMWEAHRRYIDIQVVIEGAERIGYAPIARLEAGKYDDAKDLLPLTGQGDAVTLGRGSFMLLWPGDGHMPGLAVGEPAPVKKLVVKIAVD